MMASLVEKFLSIWNVMRILSSLLVWSSLLVADDSTLEHPTIKLMFSFNNDLRDHRGKSQHKISTTLTKAAQDHAWYMARMHDKDEEDFNHRGNNGTPGQRAARYNFEGSVKENIARGYKSVSKAFEAWQESATHREAIFSDTTEAGFGYAVASDGTTYWVALYGKPTLFQLVDN